MRKRVPNSVEAGIRVLFILIAAGAAFNSPVGAQNQELQGRVAEITQAAARNKQALTQWTWVEQVNISLKGELKKQEHFQVRLGPDGKNQKTSLDAPPAPPSGRRLKQHVVEKKTEEYKEYADQMKDLAEQYLPPNKEQLQQAYERGNVTLGGEAGAPNELQIVIHNYQKPQDSMTLVVDRNQKELLRVQVASYMDSPKDAVNLTVQFSRLPDGSNQISNLTIDGASKQLNIATQNSNYQHL